jgi:hypothetical protein
MIVLPCSHQVDNDTFSKVCIFKSYTEDGGYETKTVCFNNNIIKGNEELITVVLNCTLLHNENDGWTVS